MTLAATADLVAAATANGTAVLAFNAITLEHAEGIAEGVERAGVAAIIQISENTVRFHGSQIAPLATACARIATLSSAALAVHLDHLQDLALIDDAIDTAADPGVTSIMIDAGHLPYRDNVDQTRARCRARPSRRAVGRGRARPRRRQGRARGRRARTRCPHRSGRSGRPSPRRPASTASPSRSGAPTR